MKKGKRVYDDRAFVKSLSDQYARNRSLSVRQVSALRRIAMQYKSRIPDFAAVAEKLGLASSNGDKSE